MVLLIRAIKKFPQILYIILQEKQIFLVDI